MWHGCGTATPATGVQPQLHARCHVATTRAQGSPSATAKVPMPTAPLPSSALSVRKAPALVLSKLTDRAAQVVQHRLVAVHVGDCWTARKRSRCVGVSRAQALDALHQQVPACTHCRADTALGFTE
ncbi:DUF6233 domain-containing protein [Streptomyces sp. NPDC055722]